MRVLVTRAYTRCRARTIDEDSRGSAKVIPPHFDDCRRKFSIHRPSLTDRKKFEALRDGLVPEHHGQTRCYFRCGRRDAPRNDTNILFAPAKIALVYVLETLSRPLSRLNLAMMILENVTAVSSTGRGSRLRLQLSPARGIF